METGSIYKSGFNNRYSSEENIIIPKKSLIRLFSEAGIYFEPPFTYREISDTLWYHIEEIKPDDVVIDVGANIGAFSIQAAKHNLNVFAVEPLYHKELEKNAELSNVKIKIMPVALGDGSPIEIGYGGRSNYVETMTLSEIIREAGGCDFLKLDCEGGEWFIKPSELGGIRQIEGEFHNSPPWIEKHGIIKYIRNNFDCSLTPSRIAPYIYVHAVRR